ncbi:MAG: ABC transporter substrate-binding protein [Anaerolineales bacterium]
MRKLERPHLIAIATALMLALVASACGTRGDETPRSVRLASDGFLLGTQSWVALDRGFFDEEDLDVDVSLYGTGIEAIQAVIARQADLGPALDFAVLNLAAAAEENMRVVGSIAAPKPGFHSLAVRNEINGPEDLVGKKMGYVEGTSENFVTIRYLQQNGIDLADVELIPFPGLFEMVGALRTDDIQGAWVWLAGTSEAEEDPDLKILTNDTDVLDTVAIYLVASSEWADENQDIIGSVLKAYDKTTAVINDDPVAAAQIVADAVSGDAELFAKIIPNQRYRVEFTQVQLDSFDAIAQFLIDSGKLRADFDIRDFIDFDAMEKAVPGSVTADLGS